MTKASLVIIVTVIALVSTVGIAAGQPQNFVATLSGRNEVTPVATLGTGVAKFKLDQSGTTLSYMLIVANTQDVSQAHIHCGAAGVNGSVVAFLYGLGPIVSPNGILAQGTLSAGNVITVSASIPCPGGVANFAQLIGQMQSGNAYVNVHTLANPGGEIRGQIR